MPGRTISTVRRIRSGSVDRERATTSTPPNSETPTNSETMALAVSSSTESQVSMPSSTTTPT